MAKEFKFQAKCTKSEIDNIIRHKSEIKLAKLPSKITDGEIVEQGLKLLLDEVKKEDI